MCNDVNIRPNAVMKKVNVAGRVHLWLYALKRYMIQTSSQPTDSNENSTIYLNNPDVLYCNVTNNYYIIIFIIIIVVIIAIVIVILHNILQLLIVVECGGAYYFALNANTYYYLNDRTTFFSNYPAFWHYSTWHVNGRLTWKTDWVVSKTLHDWTTGNSWPVKESPYQDIIFSIIGDSSCTVDGTEGMLICEWW